ncbi:MAG: orotidine-5'-phosphate decarboxylase [Proteocatella sp.]
MIMQELRRRAIEVSPLCVGIDLRPEHVPAEIRNSTESIGEQYVSYAKEIIEASKAYASCYKVQIACYESEGLLGLKAYSEILKMIRQSGHIAIADIKRGDIGDTAKMYAKAHFEGDFEADILTLSAYMGEDAIKPYEKYMKDKNKGAFILAKTSNSGSRDFQDLIIKDSPLYAHMLDKIYQWGKEADNTSDFAPFGAVVGVNNLNELDIIKEKTKGIFLLIPGYGAQGAKIEDIAHIVRENKNGVINVSRGYTANISDDLDFRKELLKRAQDLAKELRECFK